MICLLHHHKLRLGCRCSYLAPAHAALFICTLVRRRRGGGHLQHRVARSFLLACVHSGSTTLVLMPCVPCRRGGGHLQRRAAGHTRVPQPGAGRLIGIGTPDHTVLLSWPGCCGWMLLCAHTPFSRLPVTSCLPARYFQLLWVNLVTDGLPATAIGFNRPDGAQACCLTGSAAARWPGWAAACAAG